MPAAGAGTRAEDAPSGVVVQDALLAAARTGLLGGLLGPPSPAAAASTGPAPRPNQRPNQRLRSAGRARPVVMGRAAGWGWCPPRTSRWGCTPVPCTTPPGSTASPALAAWSAA